MRFNSWVAKISDKIARLLFDNTVNAIVLFGIAFFRGEKSQVDEKMIRHEKEHARQQNEEGFFRFLYNYLREYRKNKKSGMEHHEAYRNISYEIEARKAESKSM